MQRIDEAKPRSLTPPPATQKPAAEKDAPEKPESKDEKKETFSAGPFSRDGSRLLITGGKGWYVVTVADGKREQVLTLNEDDEEKNPRIAALDWSPDGAGIYVTCSERDRWERGLQRLTIATKTLAPLVKDSRLYSSVRMARDNGAHRPPDSVAESIDFEQRILAWYDKHLKGDVKKKPAT